MKLKHTYVFVLILGCFNFLWILYFVLERQYRSNFNVILEESKACAHINDRFQFIEDKQAMVYIHEDLFHSSRSCVHLQLPNYIRNGVDKFKQLFYSSVTEIKSMNVSNCTDTDYDAVKCMSNSSSKLYFSRPYIINALLLARNFRHHRKLITIEDVLDMRVDEISLRSLPVIWKIYHFQISEMGLPIDNFRIAEVLNILRYGEVVSVDEMEKGTQIKLKVMFSDGTTAVVKPLRVSRYYQTPPDHYYFSDIERHNAEIAAFYVDKILGFYRAPPTVGRIFNITKEIKPFAEEGFLSTFFISPAGNLCFRGQCKYYCDTNHAVCGKNRDMIEASVQLFLPSPPYVKWQRMTHPYRRSYSAKRLAEWETRPTFCYSHVFTEPSFHSRLILDMTDTAIYDFLIGNMDRHHLVKIEELSNDSSIFHIDQGRAFGRYNHDELTILEPLVQCCLVRFSTVSKLLSFVPKKLSEVLKAELSSDKLNPVLIQEHYDALDRRLMIILFNVYQCVQNIGNISSVIIDDGI